MTSPMETSSLDPLFYPASFAVVGASPDPAKVGSRPVHFSLTFGYRGKIFPVNPKYPTIAGLPCYPSLTEIDDAIDLVVVAVPAKQVLPVLEECVAKGVKAAVVYSSGFAEVGEEGKVLQEQIRELTNRTGLRVCGPNCQGIANLSTGLNVSFSTGFLRYGPKRGSLGLITQSGLVGGIIYPLGLDRDLGFSLWISTGNEADLDFADCVAYLAKDEETRIILGYLENLRDGRKLQQALREAHARGKPVLAILAGRTTAGAQAALSHTGALAGDDRLADHLFKQLGIIRVSDLQELIDSAYLFSRSRLPEGNRVGIVTNSGGTGVMMADTCVNLGLEIPAFPEELQGKIAKVLPPFGSPQNPIDLSLALFDKPEVIREILPLLDHEGPVDVLALFLGMMGGTYPLETIVPDIITLAQTLSKPLVVTWMVGVQEALETIRANGVPVYEDPTRGLKSLAALVRYASFRREGLSSSTTEKEELIEVPSKEAALQIIRSVSVPHLDEHTSKNLIATYGIPICRERLVQSEEEAVEAAKEIGFPVVAKVCSREIPHKSELGVVKVSLSTPEEVVAAVREILRRVEQPAPQGLVGGVLVQEMVRGGVEMALGAVYDRSFGPVILCGLGGIFIEVFKDVAWRMAPVDHRQALVMLRELRGYPLLTGIRGGPPADTDALTDAMVHLSHLAVDLQETIQEIDLNPVMVLGDGEGVKAVDALVVLRTEPGGIRFRLFP